MREGEPTGNAPEPHNAAAGWYRGTDGPFQRWWDGHQWTEHTQPLPGPLGVSTRSMSPGAKAAGWFITASGAVIALAALLPWASVGMITVSGTSGDGAITLILGLVSAGAGLGRALAGKASAWQIVIPTVCLVLAVLTTLIAFIDMALLPSGGSGGPFGLEASVGIGLVLTLFGGLGLAAASIAGLIKRN